MPASFDYDENGLPMLWKPGFAKQSGGEVDVRSRAGHGATFILYLPQHLAPLLPQEETPETPRLRKSIRESSRPADTIRAVTQVHYGGPLRACLDVGGAEAE